MPARLLFFGSVRALGLEFERAPADAETLKALRAWIAARSPQLAESLGSVKLRIAVDGEIVQDDNVKISAAREIAFLPPMSGG